LAAGIDYPVGLHHRKRRFQYFFNKPVFHQHRAVFQDAFFQYQFSVAI
jgi:hypothetical protein